MKCGIEQSRNKSLKLFVAVILLLTADLCVGKRINVLAAGSISEPSTRQWRKEFFLVPAAIPNVNMNTWVLFPPGPGPYRLAVIVHGTTESEELRRNYPEPVFEVLSSWLLNHNYAVALPQRPGHGGLACHL